MEMMPHFSAPKRPRFALQAKLVTPIVIVLAVILLISTMLDVWRIQRELSHILTEESNALISALDIAGKNALASFELVEDLTAERLLNNARFIEHLDYIGRLSAAELMRIAEENDLFRAALYDAEGQLLFSSRSGAGWGNIKPVSKDLLARIQQPGNEELVMGFRGNRFGFSDRYIVAKLRRKGGVILVTLDAEQLMEFRKSIGLGSLIRKIGENEAIRFIALQDTSSIIVATSNVDSLTTIQSDDFIRNAFYNGQSDSRFITDQGEKLFEVVHPFEYQGNYLLRLGLTTGHLQEAQRAAIVRSALYSLFLLIIGTVMASWLLGARNYRHLQEAYRTIETYTGNILANMSDAVLAVNRDGTIALVNRAAEKLFGIRRETAIGKPCDTALSSICSFINEALAKGQSLSYPEAPVTTPLGERFFEIQADVLYTTDRKIDSVFLVVQDITERVRLRENLKRREQITAMGQLASGVAHEIRNPLNAIAMIAQRLNLEFQPAQGAEEYRNLSSTLVGETRRINHIINQFLQFARPPQLEISDVDPAQLVLETAILLREAAEQKGIAVIENCSYVGTIRADADKLKQAFLNLGQNAIQACHEGGKVTFTCQDRGKAVQITIADNGVGIPEKDLNKIFNLYFTTKEQGSGIGLSVVQQIISQHNGTIQVSSREQQGTTMIIQLPKE